MHLEPLGNHKSIATFSVYDEQNREPKAMTGEEGARMHSAFASAGLQTPTNSVRASFYCF